MALTIRLRQQGRTNRRFYRLVVADARSPRDGKYVECIGWYNPFEEEADKNLKVDVERAKHWLSHGALITEKAEALVSRAAPDIVKAHKQQQVQKRAKVAASRKKKTA